jgi:cardiolipin synthase
VTGAGQGAAYLALVRAARREILLATPYFLPDRALTAALIRAASRGVGVTLVLPRHNDIWWFKHGARRRFDQLLAAGITIWERCDRMVHAKVAVVDSLVAAVGSTNLNRLSFHGNSETLLLTVDPNTVTEIRDLIVTEAASSADVLRSHSWPNHPDRHFLAELAASALAFIL